MKNLSDEIRYTAALRVAFIAGVFSLVVVVMMLVNYSRQRTAVPAREKKLEILKMDFRQRPEDAALARQIRNLDLEIRYSRMRRLAFSRRGALLLLAGVVLLIASLKYAGTVRKVQPQIRDSITEQSQIRRMILSRRAVTAGAVVCLMAAGGLALKDDIVYVRDKAAAVDDFETFYDNWPCFRGPSGSGVSNVADVLLEFDAESGEGILWKTPVPVIGMNSPVVWGDRVFLCGGDEQKRRVFCFDANKGTLLWTGDVESMVVGDDWSEPMEETGYSAPTMAVDGKRVYAIFATGDIAAFDFEGTKVWSKNLGGPDSIYGYASSLAMFEKLLIVQYDQGASEDGLSRLIALDGFSGQVVWQTKRPVANSWASPVIVKVGDSYQVITCADPFAIAYDPATGSELWRAECLSGDVAPSSIYVGGLVMAIEPYNTMTAIRPDGTGDVTETHIAWQAEDEIPDICSPVGNDEFVFLLTTEGVLTCFDVKDGTNLWHQEFDSMFHTSPSIVGDKLLLLSEEGEMIVAGIGREYNEISRSQLGEHCFASPAFSPGRMYIRSENNLYCIGNN